MPSRQQLIDKAREYIGLRYAPQGRSRLVGADCGGLWVMVGEDLGIVSLETAGRELTRVVSRGYSQNPNGRDYERTLDECLDRLGDFSAPPNRWDALPGDFLAFDLGQGVQHMLLITKWDGRRFWGIHATHKNGVNEAPLPLIYALALKHPNSRAYRVRGITD